MYFSKRTIILCFLDFIFFILLINQLSFLYAGGCHNKRLRENDDVDILNQKITDSNFLDLLDIVRQNTRSINIQNGFDSIHLLPYTLDLRELSFYVYDAPSTKMSEDAIFLYEQDDIVIGALGVSFAGYYETILNNERQRSTIRIGFEAQTTTASDHVEKNVTQHETFARRSIVFMQKARRVDANRRYVIQEKYLFDAILKPQAIYKGRPTALNDNLLWLDEHHQIAQKFLQNPPRVMNPMVTVQYFIKEAANHIQHLINPKDLKSAFKLWDERSRSKKIKNESKTPREIIKDPFMHYAMLFKIFHSQKQFIDEFKAYIEEQKRKNFETWSHEKIFVWASMTAPILSFQHNKDEESHRNEQENNLYQAVLHEATMEFSRRFASA